MALASSSGCQCAGRCEAVSPPLVLASVASCCGPGGEGVELWKTASPVGLLWTLPSQYPPSSCHGAAGPRPMWQVACPCLGRKSHLQDCKQVSSFHTACAVSSPPLSLKGLMSRPQASPGFCASGWGRTVLREAAS